MTYRLLQRTRDRHEGVVHLKDPMSGLLSLCGAGFSAGFLDMHVKHTEVPTCVFCIANMWTGLQYWRLQPATSPQRRVIGELCQTKVTSNSRTR